jgi:uncharacterized membrane protein
MLVPMEGIMTLAYRLVLALHVLAAVAAVVVFWVAAVTKKGTARHVWVGRLFVFSMAAMCVSALVMSAFNLAVPAMVHSLHEFRARGAVMGNSRAQATVADLAREFRLNAVWLTYVAVQLLVSLRFGMQVVRLRTTRATSLTADVILAGAVLVTGAGLIAFGVSVPHPLIATFGIMGALAMGRRLFVLLRPPRSHMAWWYEHMGTLLGAGIPLHVTMLLAIGRHLPGPPGSWRLALPAVVILGFPAITMWTRYYRRRFEPGPPRTHDAHAQPAATQPA